MKEILKIKNFLIKFGVFLLLIFVGIGSFAAFNYFNKVNEKNINILTDSKSSDVDIDYTKLKLKAELSQLTNIDKYNSLKNEMSGKSDAQIMDKALKQGIIVKQGIIIDIDALYNLKTNEDKTDKEIVEEAIKNKTIRVLGDNKITSIDIQKLYDLKQGNIDKTDEEIVQKAINKSIIQGSFNSEDLDIDADLDFTNADLSSLDLSDVEDKTFLDLNSLKKAKNIDSETLDNLNIKNGKIKTDYNISLAENPVATPKDEENQAYDVVVLVDTNMDPNAAPNSRNAFLEFFFKDSCTQFIAGENHINFVMIPYHRKDAPSDGWVKYYDNMVTHNFNNNNYGDYYRQLITKITEDCSSDKIDMNDSISNGFMRADSYFAEKDKNRPQKSSKVVMVLGSEISKDEYDKFKNNLDKKNITGDYSIISLFSGGTDGTNDYNIGYGDTLENMSKAYNSYMYKIHTDLKGLYSNFYISYQHNSGSDSHNDIRETMYSFDGVSIGEKMSKSLLDLLNGNKSITASANLQFNLGQNIILSPGQTVTSYGKNDNNENIVGIRLDNIGLKSRYCILGNNYLIVSDDFVNDLIDIILKNNHNGVIDQDDVTAYLKEQLMDLKDITVKDSDSEKIIGNLSSELSITIGQLNEAKGRPLYDTVSNSARVLNKDSYESISGIKVLDMLVSDTYNKTEKEIAEDKGKDKEKYAVVQNKIKELIRTEIKDRIQSTFSVIIKEKYDKYYSQKTALANAILNNDTNTALKQISAIMDYNLSSDDTKIQKVLKNIKEGSFNADSTLQSLLPQLSISAKAYLTESDYSTKIKDYLNNSSNNSDVKDEINQILNQLLNAPLKLTQVTYNLMEESSVVSFNIEPALKAAVDDSVSAVTFKKNTNDNEPDNDYIYVTTNQNTSSPKTSIKTVPILNLSRALINKSHIVYGSLEDTKDDYGRTIKHAVKLQPDTNQKFARNSLVTFAANISNMTGTKDIQLEIDPDLKLTESSTSTVYIGQIPRIYAYDYSDNTLKFISEMAKKNGTNNVYTASVDGAAYSNVIILYTAQESNSKNSYTNNVKVSGLSKGTGTININASEKQPDLF